ALDVGRRRVSQDTVFLTLPRFMILPSPRTKVGIRMITPLRASVSFASPVFQHMLEFDFSGCRFSCSDNFFDLYPGEEKTIEVGFDEPVTAGELRRSATHRSLADSY
ncbi:MAG TPA: glycoside hydrolase family 2 protein, partial [Opitutaceae bacterium]